MEMILTAARAALTGLLGRRKKTVPVEKVPENPSLKEPGMEENRMPIMCLPEAPVAEYHDW